MAAVTVSITPTPAAYQLVAEDKEVVRLQVSGPDSVRVHIGQDLPAADTADFFSVQDGINLDGLSPGDNVYVRAEKYTVVVRALTWNVGATNPHPNDITTEEAVETNGDTPTELSLDVYHSILTTGGSEGSEDATIGDGTGAVVGQRKLITLATLTEPTDSVTLDDANFAVFEETITGIELDAEGEFLLAEWNGEAWQILYASDGVVTLAG